MGFQIQPVCFISPEVTTWSKYSKMFTVTVAAVIFSIVVFEIFHNFLLSHYTVITEIGSSSKKSVWCLRFPPPLTPRPRRG